MILHVLNPVAKKVEIAKKKMPPAPRLQKLEGKHIGLYWNAKPGGDTALRRVGELLKARYAGLETKFYVGSIGHSIRCVTKDDVKQITQECAAVIGSTGD